MPTDEGPGRARFAPSSLLEALATLRPALLDPARHPRDDEVATALEGRRIDATSLRFDARFTSLTSGPLRPCRALAALEGPTWVEVAVPVVDASGGAAPYAARLGSLFEPRPGGGRILVVVNGIPPLRSQASASWVTVDGAGLPRVRGAAGAVDSVANFAAMTAVGALRNLDYGTLEALPPAREGALAQETLRVVARPIPAATPTLGYCVVVDEDLRRARLALVREFPAYAARVAAAMGREAVATFRARGGAREVPDDVAIASVLGTVVPDATAASLDAFDVCLPLLADLLGTPTFVVRRKAGATRIDRIETDDPSSTDALHAAVAWAERLVGQGAVGLN